MAPSSSRGVSILLTWTRRKQLLDGNNETENCRKQISFHVTCECRGQRVVSTCVKVRGPNVEEQVCPCGIRGGIGGLGGRRGICGAGLGGTWD